MKEDHWNCKRDKEKANFKKKANVFVEEAKKSLFGIAASKEEESPDPDFDEKQLATAEGQETVDLNDINDPNIIFHYFLPSTSQMRTRLPAIAMVCDRYNVSDRAAAAITSAVLQDFGIISEVDTSHVMDKNKVLRE
ncbi:hypothetical protein AVEN_149934-1 [Araneus ventricosus]|uniref:Uncharacterized protein n=1 Tax=Araneus ventricosus TaxID=182803 RepID=A0A4Y2M1A1_ARAVE|nr:hypothetical protein AVEN_149934-1 [Araneus ventricosus]